MVAKFHRFSRMFCGPGLSIPKDRYRAARRFTVWGMGLNKDGNDQGPAATAPRTPISRGPTLTRVVQILLPEHESEALNGPRVKLQAENHVTGSRAVLLVVALDLGWRGAGQGPAVEQEGWMDGCRPAPL